MFKNTLKSANLHPKKVPKGVIHTPKKVYKGVNHGKIQS